MPSASEKSAAAPRAIWPVSAITVSAATSGGATQAVTTSDDSAPISAVDRNLPPRKRPLAEAKRVCRLAGICSS